MKVILLLLSASLLFTACTALKVVTVPIKATTTVVGGAADIID